MVDYSKMKMELLGAVLATNMGTSSAASAATWTAPGPDGGNITCSSPSAGTTEAKYKVPTATGFDATEVWQSGNSSITTRAVVAPKKTTLVESLIFADKSMGNPDSFDRKTVLRNEDGTIQNTKTEHYNEGDEKKYPSIRDTNLRETKVGLQDQKNDLIKRGQDLSSRCMKFTPKP